MHRYAARGTRDEHRQRGVIRDDKVEADLGRGRRIIASHISATTHDVLERRGVSGGLTDGERQQRCRRKSTYIPAKVPINCRQGERVGMMVARADCFLRGLRSPAPSGSQRRSSTSIEARID